MASIKVELEKIAGLANGQDVLDAIASASEKVNQNEFDITEELEIIRSRANRYGIDIRMAIHDALYKLQKKTEGEGQSPLYFSDSETQANAKGIILPTILGLYEAPPCPFACDEEYFVDTAVEYTISGANYQKYNSQQAIGMGAHIDDSGYIWTSGLFISPISADAVKYVFNGNVLDPYGSVSYDGLTWYYSTSGYAQGGEMPISGLVMYPNTIPWPYTPEGIAAVLQAVHAQKVEV